MRLVFDIETDGLFDDVSKVHCIVLKDLDTKEVITPKIKKAMQLLSEAELIVGHNIIKYDIPVLQKLYGFYTEAKIFEVENDIIIWEYQLDDGQMIARSQKYPSDYLFSLSTNIKNIPKSFFLHQNYPNPFNPNTIIKLDRRPPIRLIDRKFLFILLSINSPSNAP